jgi:hypothetical protein
MLLSGGIDSSVIQLALNSQLPASTQPISHTFAPDIASFTPEIEYAQAASALFGTRHTFVPVPTADYSDWLIAAIQILGQPPHHESTPYGPALFAYLASQAQPVEYMCSAQGADALFGLRIAEDIRRAEKYQSWPLPLLSLLGQVLGPLSPSKAYGARRAAGLLRELRNPDSHLHPLNAQAAYTNWDIVYRCFTPAEIREALAYRRELEREYLDSPHLIEKTHMVDLLSDAYDTASIDHQLALAFGSQLIFPSWMRPLSWPAFGSPSRIVSSGRGGQNLFCGKSWKPIQPQL